MLNQMIRHSKYIFLHYGRLYLSLVSFSLQKTMHFRVDFFFRIIMDCVFYAVHLGVYFLAFQKAETLGGWRYDQAMVFISLFLLNDSVQMTLFSINMHQLPLAVNKGNLDYYLTRPVSPLFLLTLKDVSVSSFVNFLMGLGLVGYSLYEYQGEKGPLELLLLFVMFLCGVVVYFMCHLCILLQVFWTGNATGAATIHYDLCNFADKPHKIFPTPLRILLTSIVPYSLISSVPAEVFFGTMRWQGVLNMLAILLALTFFLRLLWSKALANYSSASS